MLFTKQKRFALWIFMAAHTWRYGAGYDYGLTDHVAAHMVRSFLSDKLCRVSFSLYTQYCRSIQAMSFVLCTSASALLNNLGDNFLHRASRAMLHSELFTSILISLSVARDRIVMYCFSNRCIYVFFSQNLMISTSVYSSSPPSSNGLRKYLYAGSDSIAWITLSFIAVYLVNTMVVLYIVAVLVGWVWCVVCCMLHYCTKYSFLCA